MSSVALGWLSGQSARLLLASHWIKSRTAGPPSVLLPYSVLWTRVQILLGAKIFTPPLCVTFRLVVVSFWALDSHPFFPSHVASGPCFLSAAAAVLLLVSFPRSRRPVVGVLGLC